MALNIKDFEGPRAPDWTDPPHDAEMASSPQGHDGKRSLENSDTHLLFIEDPLKNGTRYKLKKLDIL